MQFDPQNKNGGPVIANLLVGRNGATTLGGNSRGLSFPEDRKRFHLLRESAKAILVGGATYRAEPYRDREIALYVSSRTEKSKDSAEIFSVPPLDLIEIALSRTGGPILIEGGVKFLQEILPAKLIDLLYLTRSPLEGDGDFIPDNFLAEYQRIETTAEGIGSFEIWTPANQ